MKVKNFAGFVAVKNHAPFPVEFQWNSTVYEFEPGEVANMPYDLAYGAIKGTIYKLTEDGTPYSYILPLGHEPPEPIPPKTGDLAKDSPLKLGNDEEFKPLKTPFVDQVRHRHIQKDFSLVGDGKTNAE